MKIAHHDTDEKVFIVAEAGVNHEGNFEDAKALVREAKRVGADAVKFQTYIPSKYIAASESERFERASRFALPLDQFRKLSELAHKEGVLLFSTPLDLESIKALSPYVPVLKVSSGDMDFEPLVRAIARKRKPIILSTGTAGLPEIRKSIGWIQKETSAAFVKKNLGILHCIAAYPAPFEVVNLKCLPVLEKEFGLTIGYSDHTTGMEVPPVAVARGARIIEKHFTLSRENRTFRDHAISLEPAEFSEMVNKIRRVEVLLGKPVKGISEPEKQNAPLMRRGVAVKKFVKAGSILRPKDLLFVRPQRDFKYTEARKVIGKKVRRDLSEGSLISKEDLLS